MEKVTIQLYQNHILHMLHELELDLNNLRESSEEKPIKFDKIDRLWRKFLRTLVTLSNKLQNIIKHKYPGKDIYRVWSKKNNIDIEMRENRFLVYMRKARDVEEHSIEEISFVRPSHYEIGVQSVHPSGIVLINNLSTDSTGRIEHFTGLGKPYEIWRESLCICIPVLSRGREYIPPKIHIKNMPGNDHQYSTPLDFATAAYNYFVHANNKIMKFYEISVNSFDSSFNVSRTRLCICNSGKRYKHCCGKII